MNSSGICPCCQGQRWRPHKYTDTIDYLECEDCHYQMQNRSGDRSAHFEEEQQKFYDDDSLMVTPAFAALNAEITTRRIDTITHHLPAGSSIVEAGPGDGAVILRLLDLGYETTAVEHSQKLANRLKGRIPVLVGDFADQDLPTERHDAYCSFHVIEHVVDFQRHLEMAARCVKPGGIAFIATPNARGWEQRLPFVALNNDSAHFQLFSASGLRHALNKAGWEVIDVRTPSYAIAWLRVATRILRQLRKQDGHSTGGEYARASGGSVGKAISIFAAITKPFRVLQERAVGGNELFVVARRR